jgi:hypothetical protein
LNVLVCPGLIESGTVNPVVLKPVPVTLACVIVRTLVPGLPIWIVWEFVEPTATLPKLALEGVREISGAAATPVAERFTTADAAPPLPWTVSVPVKAPVAEGVTATVKFPDWPVGTDIGSVAPVKLNCGLEIVPWVIEIGIVPVFATAIVWVVCFPTPTFPKFTAVGLT